MVEPVNKQIINTMEKQPSFQDVDEATAAANNVAFQAYNLEYESFLKWKHETQDLLPLMQMDADSAPPINFQLLHNAKVHDETLRQIWAHFATNGDRDVENYLDNWLLEFVQQYGVRQDRHHLNSRQLFTLFLGFHLGWQAYPTAIKIWRTSELAAGTRPPSPPLVRLTVDGKPHDDTLLMCVPETSFLLNDRAGNELYLEQGRQWMQRVLQHCVTVAADAPLLDDLEGEMARYSRDHGEYYFWVIADDTAAFAVECYHFLSTILCWPIHADKTFGAQDRSHLPRSYLDWHSGNRFSLEELADQLRAATNN